MAIKMKKKSTRRPQKPPAKVKSGRDWLVDYFARVETALVEQSKAAEFPNTASTETGRNREYLVARFLESHLPRLASVATGGVVIDAMRSPKKHQQEDVLVVNPFTAVGCAFPAGYYPVEAVYCAIQVKSNWSQLRDGVRQATSTKSLEKAIRPETIYFGFMAEKGERPSLANRRFRADTGVWIWPSGFPKPKATWEGNIRSAMKQPEHAPSFVYVPKRLLLFKTYPEHTAHQASLFPFCDPRRNIELGDFTYCTYAPDAQGRQASRLQVLLFWLSQGILQFIHEVPDLFAYAFRPALLHGRQGYASQLSGDVVTYRCVGSPKWTPAKAPDTP